MEETFWIFKTGAEGEGRERKRERPYTINGVLRWGVPMTSFEEVT